MTARDVFVIYRITRDEPYPCVVYLTEEGGSSQITHALLWQSELALGMAMGLLAAHGEDWAYGRLPDVLALALDAAKERALYEMQETGR